jgi:hypothetical protein
MFSLNNPKVQNAFCIVLAVTLFFVLTALYAGQILGLNYIGETFLNIPKSSHIVIETNWHDLFVDVAVGASIYLKTAVDFAILTGLLMAKYPGFKNRVAIENGTALGNTLGTMVVLTIWFFFKDIQWLLALMVLLASLVLFELAKGGIEHIEQSEHEGEKVPRWVKSSAKVIDGFLSKIMVVVSPVLSKIMPNMKFDETKQLSFKGLLLASFTIPFILGLDDFAGYVTLFNVVNVFGFGVGVFLGHTLLNVALFINPSFTIKTVKNPVVSLLGTLAFIGLACYGLFEVGKITLELFGVIGHH